MYDQVVKCQRAGLCLSEHFLIQFSEHLNGRLLRLNGRVFTRVWCRALARFGSDINSSCAVIGRACFSSTDQPRTGMHAEWRTGRQSTAARVT